MTWAAVGSFISGTTTFTLTPGGTGDLVLLEVQNGDTGVWCTGVSSSNAIWTPMGVKFTGTANTKSAAVFGGKITSTAAATVTLTFNGIPFNPFCIGQEFSSTVGSWAFDVQGQIDSSGGTNTWAPLTPAASGELYWGFAFDRGTAVGGSTAGYTYVVVTNGNGMAYNLSCAGGVATAPVWGDSGMQFGVMVLMREVPQAVIADDGDAPWHIRSRRRRT